jgi:hypothetical protein
MLDLKEKYIINKQQEPIAVQLDIKTFKKIEETLEDFALSQYMNETEFGEKFALKEAKEYYKNLLINQ